MEIINEVPGKLYSGAIVNYPAIRGHGKRIMMNKVIVAIKELHRLLKCNKAISQRMKKIYGVMMWRIMQDLLLEEEYEFLSLMNEFQRQEYLKRHLAKVLPVVAEMES